MLRSRAARTCLNPHCPYGLRSSIRPLHRLRARYAYEAIADQLPVPNLTKGVPVIPA